MRLAGGCSHNNVLSRELLLETLRNLFSNLKAPGADGRPHGGRNMFGTRAAGYHSIDGSGSDTPDRSSPSRMHGSNHSGFRIGQHHRNTVGSVNAEHHTGKRSHHRVDTLRRHRAHGKRGHGKHCGGMCLSRSHKPVSPNSGRIQHHPTAFIHMEAIIGGVAACVEPRIRHCGMRGLTQCREGLYALRHRQVNLCEHLRRRRVRPHRSPSSRPNPARSPLPRRIPPHHQPSAIARK